MVPNPAAYFTGSESVKKGRVFQHGWTYDPKPTALAFMTPLPITASWMVPMGTPQPFVAPEVCLHDKG